MTLTAPITVIVERPLGAPLSRLMSEMRFWLDRKKIEPLSFKTIAGHGRMGFEISFRDQYEAELFQQEFV